MSRIERSNENYKILYSSKMTKNCKRFDENDKIYSQAERKGATKTMNLTKTTKIAVATKMTKNRKRVDENDEIYSRAERKGAMKTTNLTKSRCRDENDEKSQEGRRK